MTLDRIRRRIAAGFLRLADASNAGLARCLALATWPTLAQVVTGDQPMTEGTGDKKGYCFAQDTFIVTP